MQMQLYDEIYEGVRGARCSFLPNGGGYFQGVSAVCEILDSEIKIEFKKTIVRVCGECLEIKKYCDGDLEIGGKILAVAVVGND